MSSVCVAHVIWINDLKELTIQQCHELHRRLQLQPIQARYLVISVPCIPTQFLRSCTGRFFYQQFQCQYLQYLQQWSSYWNIPLSHCWLEEYPRLSCAVIAKRLGRPVNMMIVGIPPKSMWLQMSRLWAHIKDNIKSHFFERKETAYETKNILFKKTIKKTSNPSLSVLCKYTISKPATGGPHAYSRH